MKVENILSSPYTEYEFGVLAMNNVGRGQKSVPVFATTGETSKIILLVFISLKCTILVSELLYCREEKD